MRASKYPVPRAIDGVADAPAVIGCFRGGIMAKSRSTFGKIQREQEKRERAREKQERRELRKENEDEEVVVDGSPIDESKILMEFAKIHEDFADGRMSQEDFETRQEELRQLLMAQ